MAGTEKKYFSVIDVKEESEAVHGYFQMDILN
jgi:hypothetical protein